MGERDLCLTGGRPLGLDPDQHQVDVTGFEGGPSGSHHRAVDALAVGP
jgi:hypothetical protein